LSSFCNLTREELQQLLYLGCCCTRAELDQDQEQLLQLLAIEYLTLDVSAVRRLSPQT
jgi:hypothetical protein